MSSPETFDATLEALFDVLSQCKGDSEGYLTDEEAIALQRVIQTSNSINQSEGEEKSLPNTKAAPESEFREGEEVTYISPHTGDYYRGRLRQSVGQQNEIAVIQNPENGVGWHVDKVNLHPGKSVKAAPNSEFREGEEVTYISPFTGQYSRGRVVRGDVTQGDTEGSVHVGEGPGQGTTWTRPKTEFHPGKDLPNCEKCGCGTVKSSDQEFYCESPSCDWSTFAAQPGTKNLTPKKKFSSTQFDIKDAGYSRSDGSPMSKIEELRNSIAEEDLAEDGYETTPHITVKYGLHTDDPEEVKDIVREWVQSRSGQPGYMSVRATLGKVSLFEAKENDSQRGGNQFDVVKIDVDSEDLRSLNEWLSEHLEHTDTHPKYQPHVTLAYVKPGLGKKYVSQGLDNHQVDLHRLIFSDQDRHRTVIDLWGIEEEKKAGIKAISTPCQTPGSQFHTHIRDGEVSVKVDLPESVSISEEEAERLEINLHNAVELVLAPLFANLSEEKCLKCGAKTLESGEYKYCESPSCDYQVKSKERRKDKRGHNYCVEKGQGKVACNDTKPTKTSKPTKNEPVEPQQKISKTKQDVAVTQQEKEDTAANRPTKPEERKKDVKLPKKPWVAPPKPHGEKGKGIVRPKGKESNTAIGDALEQEAEKMGFRNILPENQRSHKSGEVKKKGSTIDREYDHSGILGEIKGNKSNATEYKAGPKAEEVEGKYKFANSHKAKGVTTVTPILDLATGDVYWYWREGIKPSAKLHPEKGEEQGWNFMGITHSEYYDKYLKESEMAKKAREKKGGK